MGQKWQISPRRWVFDPMQREAARLLGCIVAPTALRLQRAGKLQARFLNRKLLFDMVVLEGDDLPTRERKERVRRCFEQFKRVHMVKREVPGQGWKYEYARVDDDMVAGVENAIDLIDSRPVLDKKQKLPSRRVWAR